jgi:lysozyme
VKLSDQGLALIKAFESCRLKTYPCYAGVPTIGYGHTGPDVTEGLEITQEEADMLLRLDVARFERCVERTCPQATQSQFDACVSLAFNIGESAFARSSVARLHKAGRYPEAQQAFALWNKVKGKVVGGLVTRRACEAGRYDDDDLPTDVEGMPQAVDGEQPLSKSRTVSGSTIAGAATAAGAGIKALPDIPAPAATLPEPTTILDSGATVIRTVQTHQDLLPMIFGYAQQYSWILVIVALAGIGYTLYARHNDRAAGRS